MEVDFSRPAQDIFSSLNLVIVGLGLMGGSFGLALRGRFKNILGYDLDPYAVQEAISMGAVDRGSSDALDIIPQADIIVYATPVISILEALAALPQVHPSRAIVFDLGSTKEQVVTAMQQLPDRFDPIGGHPMCGKEKSGVRNAEAGLFFSAPFALVPLERTMSRTRLLIAELVDALGARQVWVDAVTHDAWVAQTSHLPYLMSALLASLPTKEALQLSGSGLRSMTRLAGSDRTMMLDIIRSNRANISAELAGLRTLLDALQAAIEMGQEEQIGAMIERGLAAYNRIHTNTDTERSKDEA